MCQHSHDIYSIFSMSSHCLITHLFAHRLIATPYILAANSPQNRTPFDNKGIYIFLRDA